MRFKEILGALSKILSNSIVKSVVIIIAALAVYKIVSYILSARGRRLKKLEKKSRETYLRLVNSIFKYTLFVICFFALLQVNNVNITSMVAGLGIAGIILGVAVQDALKDIIRGFDIISDNYFKVGDLVEYNGIEGKVLELGLKTTKIRDIKNDNIISIPNRNIDAIGIVSNLIYIDIPMPYETPLSEAEKAVDEICAAACKTDNIKKCVYIGVTELGDSAIKYYIKVVLTDNAKKLQSSRDVRRVILDVMAANKIPVPYTQIDVHTK
ncbi:MAG: mechanosensitive ion channel family protein [Clostridia bacterium]|nr:mechanosensitive ion channel family protein [Clostridia bacterium]